MFLRKGFVLTSLVFTGAMSCAVQQGTSVPQSEEAASSDSMESDGLVVPDLANDNYQLAIAPVYINLASQLEPGTSEYEVVVVDKSVRVQNGDLCLTMMNDVYARDNHVTWLPCAAGINDFNFPKQNFDLLSSTTKTAEIPDVNAIESFYLFTVMKDVNNGLHAFVLSFGEGQNVNLKYLGSPEDMINTLRDSKSMLPALFQRAGTSLRVLDKEISRREFCFPANITEGQAILTETQGPNFGNAACAENLIIEETHAWTYYQAKADTFMGNLYNGYQFIQFQRPGQTSNCLAYVNGAFDYKSCDLAHQNEVVNFMYQNTKYATGYNSGVFEMLHTLENNTQLVAPNVPKLVAFDKETLDGNGYGKLTVKSWGEGSIMVPTLVKSTSYILMGQDYQGSSFCVSTQSFPSFYSAPTVEFNTDYCQAFQIKLVKAL